VPALGFLQFAIEHGGQLVSHAAVLSDWPGPYPFSDVSGQLLD
jgi:hypothetical protein